MQDIDLIVGNPTAADRDPFQHIEAIMQAASTEDTRASWPLDDPLNPVLIKQYETPKSATRSWQEKIAAAKEHAEALALKGDVTGKRILLVDDVFTTGAQFFTVAKFLRQSGLAAEVRGLVLARVPWGA
ncbi:ComF family protein [Actinacidiphila sp. ITFR-21]|uniref:ComF family protein n=1 Tax=Actinacidiphila sp. ITFR-21 TaxID=3075199 RepID=UPI00288B6057|nr:hypothetical protein [Streptomyces sp. ITFR-21]WNI19219.1 hypothetical protein RLT57_29190 [Streptomyces sp. ITFR-21]